MKRKLNAQDIPEPALAAQDAGNKPKTSPSFLSFQLDSRLLQALQSTKIATPTPVQAKVIPNALEGKSLLARAKTGSGKTLAYLLPILHSILNRKTVERSPQRKTVALILTPSKELASQTATVVAELTTEFSQLVKCENISRKEDVAVTRARLAELPDVVISTPGQAAQFVEADVLTLSDLKHLVIDEADLVLSYGYEDDLTAVARSLPAGTQISMMSATLRTEIDTLSNLFFPQADEANKPIIIDLSAQEASEKPTLAQYTVRTAEDEKFLLIYTIFKLKLIRGKVIIFVADIDRCYRVKLFLEQFGIRSCVLNSELPVNSRLHVVNEFNRGVYDIMVAADDTDVVGGEATQDARQKPAVEDEDEDATSGTRGDKEDEITEQKQQEEQPDPTAAGDALAPVPTERPLSNKRQRRSKHSREDREFGVSRGIDFRHVTCVLNFDLPTTSKSYTHRIGRTARAGQVGMSLSFYIPESLYRKHKPTSIPQCKDDEKILAKIRARQAKHGAEIKEWGLDWAKLDGFRYRFADALRSVTRIAVREARTKELRSELIKSERLKRHFEENPDELRHLRHDTESHAVRQQLHLKNVPDYLLPEGGKPAVTKDIGFVGFRKDSTNRIRKARAFNKARGKGRIASSKGLDPLRSFNARGRAKK